MKWNHGSIHVTHQHSSNLYVRQVSLTQVDKIVVGCHSLGPVCGVGCSASELYRCLRAEEWWDVQVLGSVLGTGGDCALTGGSSSVCSCTCLISSNMLSQFCLFCPGFFFISSIPASLSWPFLLSLLILPCLKCLSHCQLQLSAHKKRNNQYLNVW